MTRTEEAIERLRAELPSRADVYVCSLAVIGAVAALIVAIR